MTTEERIWRFLRDRIGNPRGAAGLMGNLCAESGLNPRNLQGTYEKSLGMTDEQYTAAVDDGSYAGFSTDRAGYGLAQWTYSTRKAALLQYAQAQGTSIGDLDMQLEFLISELKTDFRGVWETLRSALTVREASDAVMLKFERPKNQSEENQIKRAQMGVRYYEKHGREGGSMNYLKIYRRYLTNSSCYQSSAKITPTGVQVHSTGANNPWLRRYVQPDDGRIGKNTNNNDHNRGGNVCAHAYIGKQADGTVAVYQTLPWDKRCWLSGKGPNGNANKLGYVGFEICEDSKLNEEYFRKAMDAAMLLTAYLCQAFSLNPDIAVQDHSELHDAGLASNHGDITHWLRLYDLNMDDFRDGVKEKMEEEISVTYIDCDEVKTMYRAKVTANGYLNLRSGKSKSYASLAAVKPGECVYVTDDTDPIWWHVNYGNLTGWMMGQYLTRVTDIQEINGSVKEESDASKPAPEDSASEYVTINKAKLIEARTYVAGLLSIIEDALK